MFTTHTIEHIMSVCNIMLFFYCYRKYMFGINVSFMDNVQCWLHARISFQGDMSTVYCLNTLPLWCNA